MKIRYLGHSCFLMTDSAGTAVVCDPYDSSVGIAMPPVKADIVTLSHHHYDHDNAAAVGGLPVVIDSARGYLYQGVKVDAYRSFHDDKGGTLRGNNIIFKYRMDGLNVCHMGDLGESFKPELVKALAPVDVLLIPVGGNYTIDAAEAKRYIEGIKPSVVIPMHYFVDGLKVDIAPIEKFLSLFLNEALIEKATGEITLSNVDMCGDKIKIIVMERV